MTILETLATLTAGGAIAVGSAWVTHRLQASEAERIRLATVAEAATVRLEQENHEKLMRLFDDRRRAYAEFLHTARTYARVAAAIERHNARFNSDDRSAAETDLNQAYDELFFLAPAEVASAAEAYLSALVMDDLEALVDTWVAFVDCARADLGLMARGTVRGMPTEA